MAKARTQASSSLLLDEHFEAGDDRFVDEVLALSSGKKLKSLADRWFRDARPFARRTLLAYIDDGCDRPHHRPLVKALFKLAEKRRDDEVMGHFLVAFDRLVRRKLVAIDRYDWNKGDTVKERVLERDRRFPTAYGGRNTTEPHFSMNTRRYLARRALRYFRSLGQRDPLRYGKAIRAALPLYRDEHLDKPEHLLDAWGLVHVLYHGSLVLDRSPRGVAVADGRSLAELSPTPLYPAAWKGCFDGILALVTGAQSRTVRVFAIALLKAWYVRDLDRLSVARLRPLLASAHEEVQLFAAELLRSADGIASLTVAEWLELLRIDNQAALVFLCEAIKKHVAPARLTLEQCVDLAVSPVAPVAELGIAWTKEKPWKGKGAIETLLRLAGAGAPRVRSEAASFLVSVLASAKEAKAAHVRDLIDARFEDVRREALALFEREVRFKDDTSLWSALAESPYDDVRAFLLGHLEERQRAFAPETLQSLWATTLLSVHRGSRDKRAALAQIASRIVARPGDAEPLVALLGLSLRSVRPAERRNALAAVTRAAFEAPALRAAIGKKLPELRLFEEERA
ncbi:hypothetical protein E8A73_046910 [Polyangium aurulentum]|nr:hypothetical protein E8A73_046910 [Polyangium aurulentum]